MATEPLLDVRNITTGYGSTPILRGIDLAIQPGEIVAVIGRNGVGKTTMMRSLIGQLPRLAGLDKAQRPGDLSTAARAPGADWNRLHPTGPRSFSAHDGRGKPRRSAR